MKRLIHDFLPDVKDYYTIYDDGRVYSSWRGGRFLKTTSRNGYPRVILSTYNNGMQTFSIHRLVGLAFIPLVEGKELINHIDGNRYNNHVENLEWVDYKENHDHAVRIGSEKDMIGENNISAKLTEEDVKRVFQLRKEGLTHQAIGQIVGCSKANITKILNHKIWSSVTFND